MSFLYHFYLVGRDNTVGIATRYGLDSPATDSRWLFGPHTLPYNWHLVSFPGIRQPGRGVDHPPPSNAIPLLHLWAIMVSSRVNFNFLLFKSQGREGEAWKPFRKSDVLSSSQINPLQTKRRLLYLKTQSVPRCKHFSSRL